MVMVSDGDSDGDESDKTDKGECLLARDNCFCSCPSCCDTGGCFQVVVVVKRVAVVVVVIVVLVLIVAMIVVVIGSHW